MKILTCVLLIAATVIVLIICASLCILSIRRGNSRNDKLLSGQYDTVLSRELAELAGHPLEAIFEYQRNFGQYPSDINSLIPDYLTKLPSSYMSGRLVYIAEPYYGAPFYFGFSGNYSGQYFLHGWAIAYCPVSICTIPDSGTRRIDDTWIFIHSSAF